jgi:MFS family permease
VLGCGLTLMAAGLALFARVSVGGGYVADFLLPGLLVSTGIGLSIVPSTIAATASAAPGQAGLASGLVNTSRQLGGALGLAVLTSLAVLYTDHLTTSDYQAPIVALNDGFRLAFLLAAALAAAGALVAFRLIPRGAAAVAPPSVAAVQENPDARAALRPLPGASTLVAKGGEPHSIRLVERPVRDVSGRGRHAGAAASRERSRAPGEKHAGDRGRRPATRPVARVVLSAADGRGWALAPGSLTVSTIAGESGRSS